MMKYFYALLLSFIAHFSYSQQTQNWNSAEILLHLKKLKVLGTVLYVAAHPDDENTRLLAWLSKEKLYRTGYLSITRGDGGQNLIGDEQGIELGLIRTQELLAARRIDGAEQFFTRAYDFGFSKSTDEAMRIWDKEKILADVVWIIRKFQPDVIVTRFPEDNRAGHGHHSGSAVLAHEAFKAAADANRFPEQFKYGVRPWQAKRIMWNTFNFGNTNTTSENQFKVDVGAYNALLGKSYGELAAESRSQHKSQGFGVPSSRGAALEYFSLLEGDAPVTELLDGVITGWEKVKGGKVIASAIDVIIKNFSFTQPEKSVASLVKLYQSVEALADGYWKEQKLKEIQKLIEACSGLYMEASTNQEYAVQGDSVRIGFWINNRGGVKAELRNVSFDKFDSSLNKGLAANTNFNFVKTFAVPDDKPLSQPYWLKDQMLKGSFVVNNQQLIGKPQNGPAYEAVFKTVIEGKEFVFTKPVQYKHTDPVKGELFQPLAIFPPFSVRIRPEIYIGLVGAYFTRTTTSYKSNNRVLIKLGDPLEPSLSHDSAIMQRGEVRIKEESWDVDQIPDKDGNVEFPIIWQFKNKRTNDLTYDVVSINYDHIPSINYFKPAKIKIEHFEWKTDGKKIGYIKGAGDKVPEALQQMGYELNFLEEKDITADNLKQFDAVVAGVRAYNVHEWLNTVNDVLNDYVKNGGNFLVQYNTNSFVGPARFKMGPYPFVISRNRITDEDSKVNFPDPANELLNWPNKITDKDFEGWVQERGVYFADQVDPNYKAILSMKDPGEAELKGSLIAARYGKGRFIYTGLAFFRQLPAGVPGAYRLFANLIANPNSKNDGATK
ncbi:MAG: PIG-L family deacetylase [Chitinophagaceae bacterium]|nr:PIG-L family deacetylase [Chitinophagaceae bacterium]